MFERAPTVEIEQFSLGATGWGDNLAPIKVYNTTTEAIRAKLEIQTLSPSGQSKGTILDEVILESEQIRSIKIPYHIAEQGQHLVTVKLMDQQNKQVLAYQQNRTQTVSSKVITVIPIVDELALSEPALRTRIEINLGEEERKQKVLKIKLTGAKGILRETVLADLKGPVVAVGLNVRGVPLGVYEITATLIDENGKRDYRGSTRFTKIRGLFD